MNENSNNLINEETDIFEDEPLSQESTPQSSFNQIHHSTPANKSIGLNKSKINSLLYSVGKEIHQVTPITKNDVYKSIHALDDADRRNVKKTETKGRNLCYDFSVADVKDSFNDSLSQYDIELSELVQNENIENDKFIGPVNLDEKTRKVFFAEEPNLESTEIEENFVEDGSIFNEISADIEKHFAENSIIFSQEMDCSDTEENEEGQTVIALNNSLKSIEKIGRVLSQKGNLSVSFIDPEHIMNCSQRLNHPLISTQTFVKSAIDMNNSAFKGIDEVSQHVLMKQMFQDDNDIDEIKEGNPLESKPILYKYEEPGCNRTSVEILDTHMVSENIFPNEVLNYNIPTASQNETDFFGEELGLSNQEITMVETIGFSTAAGKPVTVSATSLEKAKNLFNEDLIEPPKTVDFITEKVPPKNTVLPNSGENLIVDCNKSTVELAAVQTKDGLDLNKSMLEYPVFMTAGGKTMKASEESLAKAAKLFDDDFDYVQPFKESLTKVTKLVNDNLTICSKSSSQTHSFAAEQVQDSESLPKNTSFGEKLNDFDQPITPAENPVHTSNLTKQSQISDNFISSFQPMTFKTAAGKSVQVSEESLAKAVKLFDDDFIHEKTTELIEENPAQSTNKSLNKNTDSFIKSVPFRTPIFSANLTKVPENPNKVSKLFDDDSNDFVHSTPPKIVTAVNSLHCNKILDNTNNSFNKGLFFTTAAGKPIQPCKENVEKAAKLFDDIDENHISPETELVSTPVYPSVKSLPKTIIFDESTHPVFSTAAGKPIQLSKESLAKAAKLFDDDLESDFSSSFSKKINRGLSTAEQNIQHVSESEKLAHVSEQNLNENTTLLESGINVRIEKNEELLKEVNCPKENEEHETQLNILLTLRAFDQESALSNKTNEHNSNKTRPSSLPNLNILKETNRTPTRPKSGLSLKRMKSSLSQNNSSSKKFVEKSHKIDENHPLLEYIKNKTSPLIEDSPLNLNGKRTAKTEKHETKARKLFSEEADIFDDNCLESLSQDVMDQESNRLTKRKSIDPKLEPEPSKKLRLSQNFDDERIQLHLIARKKQEDIIKNKLENKKDAQLSSWFISKENKNLVKLNHVFGENIKTYTINQLIEYGVQDDILNITSKNSSEYKFQIDGYESNYEKYIDGFLVVPDINGNVGIKEIVESFLTGPDIDPSFLNKNWVENHFRWIVWKLSAYEKTFPEQCVGRCLNIHNLLLQLKYRYDKEIIKAHKSAFKKIIEGDEKPGKTFICCVASIKKIDLDQSDHSLELELTDGWYSLNAIVDTEMFNYVRNKKVQIGTKLIVCGAELLNFNSGYDILNMPSDFKFKIHTNSTRRVKWYVKMGFYKENILAIGLTSILPNGGMICLTTGIIARVYPILYMSKDTDGKTIFRNEKTQCIEDERCDKLKNEKAESIHEMIWKDVEKNHIPDMSGKDINIKDIKNVTDPEILYAIFKDSSDYSIFSTEQLKMATSYHEKITNKIRLDVENMIKKQLQEETSIRKAIKLLKVKIVDYFTGCPFLLTIWQPTDDTIEYIQECIAVDLYNIYASGIRDKLIQLQTTRQTKFIHNECLQKVSKYRRKITKLCEFTSDSFSPLFGEVEIVGVVIHVKIPTESHGVTKVYLTDLDSNYVAIIFWTCLSKFGCEDIMEEGALISCSNLQWRIGSRSMTIPCVYATETSSFSQNPKEEYFKQEINVYNSIKKNFQDFATDEKSKLLTLVNPYEICSQKSQIDLNSPTTPCQKRIKLLSRFGGQMTSLSPVPLANKHPSVKKEFMSPFRTK